jgi:prepilin-type N-terminal cleavage/methylation domain-containing protein
MRITVADAASSRNKGFSLVEVAVAVALLSIATAFSLPRVNRLASHLPAVSQNAPPDVAPSAARPPSGVKVKLLNLIHGFPARGTGRVIIDWGDFGTGTEANFHAPATSSAPSGEKTAAFADTPQSGKSAAAGPNLETNTR